ncbi:LytR C-terminal domain-containing protein [Streptomyces sp. DSM 110735]|uniref:LytR C-terminal domain-containing protein n=1 Tax=Streptomyces sp. DSM 110735 TaxID=2775031 RepID=UPI0018F6DB3B|nr:LytR C-terminal domain-containing protein [Streptomyces sp. DSM 110735]MBJ7907635.1 LytR C-terminal domain-containing protein [Streptomyces sp. DSM 110735]
MNDRYDAGYGGEQYDDQYDGNNYEIVGYDDYGRPVYQQVPARSGGQDHDPYARQGYGQGGYDTGQQPPVPPAYDPYGTQGTQGTQGAQGTDPYGQYDGYGTQGTQGGAAPYDPYGQAATSGQQPRVTEQTAHIPQQGGPASRGAAPEEPEERTGSTPAPAREGQEPDGEEQFAFAEEPDGESEDVIDWLKFTENRTERREEARRRARSRVIALVVVLALVAVGGVGYLWFAGKLPGLSSAAKKGGTAVAAGAQKRDVIVVHLHNTGKSGTSTVLLVDNTTTKRGTTVLLPNSLALSDDSGTTTTLAKSVDDDGSSGTRDQIDTVLGTSIQGTWRLDTPYLQNLVELVGGIEVDTTTDVPDPDAKKKGAEALVHRGKDQTLSGKMAVAYATYRAPGETQNAQLERFGQVLQGVLRKVSSDPSGATTTVQTLAQILDPSLTDKDLGAFLAKLAELAKDGSYKTVLLPVQSDGTLTAQTSDSVVKDVLGGAAKSPDAGSAVRVSVQNGTGVKDDAEKARVVLLNGGFTFVDGGSAGAQSASRVVYSGAADKENATEVAKTLGLPDTAVTKGSVTSGADVLVVLGQDYRPGAS